VYFKPVAVLNNANCYSACELFSAAMQDTRGAFIFGEDPQTGGGGANVLTHRFFMQVLPEVFQKLPHGQNMNIGWRQTVRFGVNEGKLIEDTGVVADFVVRPRTEDLLPGKSTFSQMQFITWKLGVQGRTDNKKHISCKLYS
jgi:C-terminal processing protease CtpA/Prc